QGNAYLDQNQLASAVTKYQEALALSPNHGDALLNLGFALQSMRRFEQAQNILQKRTKLSPPSADAHYMLAAIALSNNRVQDAIFECESALKVHPAFEAAVLMLVDLLGRTGEFDKAKLCLSEFCANETASPHAHFLLAQLLIRLDQKSAALISLQRVQNLEPEFPKLRLALAQVYELVGQIDSAMALYQEILTSNDQDRAFALDKLAQFHLNTRNFNTAKSLFEEILRNNPRALEALNNLGTIEKNLGAKEQALRHFESALQIEPNNANVLCNFSLCLHELGRHDEAIKELKRAIELAPEHSVLHFNLANIYSDRGQFLPANQHYMKALEIDPSYAEAHSNYGFCLRQQGKSTEAIAHYKTAFNLRPDLVVALSNAIFVLSYHPDFTPADYIEHARAYDKAICKGLTPFEKWNCSSSGKLRLGFVSGDLRTHPVCYFLENILKHLDQEKFELVAYSTFAHSDEGTQRLKKYFELWRTIDGLNDDEAAKCIHEDGVHILFDLAGYTAHNRLPVFAHKPAPVQVTWLGYFASTGLSSIDYLIADPHTLPPDQEPYFSEKIWRLPETRLCFSEPQSDVSVDPLPALENGYIRFASFNQLVKMNDEVVELWCEILRQVPNSRLLLKSPPFAEQDVQKTTLARFTNRGIAPERIEIEGPSSRDDYFRAYHKVDICLDPFPYTGGTTTMESLWMGVPVISLKGTNFLARQGLGMLINTGLSEWVANDKDHYVQLAVQHSQSLHNLAALRQHLRQQVVESPMCDGKRFAQFFSEALETMWARASKTIN
ncbi:MAG: glycosyltransferase family 41 protein, partial [Burkholderiaceae bacterium]